MCMFWGGSCTRIQISSIRLSSLPELQPNYNQPRLTTSLGITAYTERNSMNTVSTRGTYLVVHVCRSRCLEHLAKRSAEYLLRRCAFLAVLLDRFLREFAGLDATVPASVLGGFPRTSFRIANFLMKPASFCGLFPDILPEIHALLFPRQEELRAVHGTWQQQQHKGRPRVRQHTIRGESSRQNRPGFLS